MTSVTKAPSADKPGLEFVETGRKLSAASLVNRFDPENEDYMVRIYIRTARHDARKMRRQ